MLALKHRSTYPEDSDLFDGSHHVVVTFRDLSVSQLRAVELDCSRLAI